MPKPIPGARRAQHSCAHDDTANYAGLVVLTADQLTALVREAVRLEIARLNSPPATRASDRLTFAEFCEAYRCSARTARRMIAAGRVRTEKLTDGGSRRVFIRRAELDRLLAEIPNAEK